MNTLKVKVNFQKYSGSSFSVCMPTKMYALGYALHQGLSQAKWICFSVMCYRFLEQKEWGGNDEQRCRSRGFHRVTRRELGGKRQGSKSLMCSCPYIDQHMQRKKQAEGTAKLRAAERNRDWHAWSLGGGGWEQVGTEVFLVCPPVIWWLPAVRVSGWERRHVCRKYHGSRKNACEQRGM